MLFTYNSDTPNSTILFANFSSIQDLIKTPQSVWDKLIKNKINTFLAPSKIAYRGPEVGAPPVKTKNGWLLIYCGESKKREWTINAALLDLENPQKILWQSKGPILKPEKLYEKRGVVTNVTFPEGAVIRNGKLMVYYGAGDKFCCLATAPVSAFSPI